MIVFISILVGGFESFIIINSIGVIFKDFNKIWFVPTKSESYGNLQTLYSVLSKQSEFHESIIFFYSELWNIDRNDQFGIYDRLTQPLEP